MTEERTPFITSRGPPPGFLLEYMKKRELLTEEITQALGPETIEDFFNNPGDLFGELDAYIHLTAYEPEHRFLETRAKAALLRAAAGALEEIILDMGAKFKELW